MWLVFIHLRQDSFHWWALVNMWTTLRLSEKSGNFLTCWMTVSWKNVFLGGNSLYHTNTLWFTVLFAPGHFLYDGELLPENFCMYQPIKCRHILISNNTFLRIFKLWVLTISILNPWIVSYTSVISFYTLQYNHSLYLTPMKIATWLAEMYVIRYSMYKLISIHLRAFVGTIIVYTDIYTLVNYCPLQIQQVGFL